MHIGPKGVVKRSVYADFSGYHWAFYKDRAGAVVAMKDGGTLWLQGDAVAVLEAQRKMILHAGLAAT